MEQRMKPSEALDIAIIGMAGRFPGAAGLEPFWQNLSDGVESIRRFSDDELLAAGVDPAALKRPTYVKAAPVLDDIESFDAAFFNIFPREAAAMDPQQRLLLETAWHALESAGLANARLRGSATGTFVGVSTSDYAQLALKSGDPARIDAYFGTGNALNAVAGRVAYTFGLRGPTLVTDTACSSSLVALHQACQSLRAGECTQALAAGVNLMLTPEPMIALSRARMLEKSCEVLEQMVLQLRAMKLESMKELNDRLQAIENEADRLILELYRDMYRNENDPVRFLLRKDLFEILEKAIDRCRDAGNVVYAIVLKNS